MGQEVVYGERCRTKGGLRELCSSSGDSARGRVWPGGSQGTVWLSEKEVDGLEAEGVLSCPLWAWAVEAC